MTCVQCSDCLSSTKNNLRLTLESKSRSSLDLLWHSAYFFHNHRPHWSGYMQSATTGTYSEKSHITLLPLFISVHQIPLQYIPCYGASVTKLPKFSIETPCITSDHPLNTKSFKISKSLQMEIVIRLRGFQLLMSFLGSIGSVMKGLGLKDGVVSIYAPVTSRGHFLPESATFALILSNAMPEDFITASFRTDDQNRMNEMNETENEAENSMNETENNQIEESGSTNEGPFNLIREESQESEKSPKVSNKE